MIETFSYSLLNSMEERWEEVEILMNLAESEKADEKLYGVLCRSATVLMVAQFEGFIKICVKSVIEDANKFSRFADLPENMKRTYCGQLLRFDGEKTNSKDFNFRVGKLISVLAKAEVEIDHQCFLIMNDYGNDQNNPKPDLIDKICSNFGVGNFFSLLDESDFDVFFKNDKFEATELLEKIKTHLSEGLLNYPYKLNYESFNITSSEMIKPNKSKSRTIWQSFLDEINRQRHAIAHGSSSLNEISLEDVKINKEKLLAIQYAFMMLICQFSIKGDVE